MPGRVDRGFAAGGEPPFDQGQRIWLLERDLDDYDQEFKELREEVVAMRRLVTTRLNTIIALAFSLLISVVAVLVTVIASSKP